MSFFGCLLYAVLAIFLVFVALANILWYRIRQFFGLGEDPFEQRRKQSEWQKGPRSNAQSGTQNQQKSAQSKPKKKVFEDDEGEYVEFEEVKD